MAVRFAREEELPRVNALRSQVNDVHVAGRPDVFRPGFSQEMQDFLYAIWRDPDKEIAVCERNGAICGFAVLHRVKRPESPIRLAMDYIDIDEFGVDAACRRQASARR